MIEERLRHDIDQWVAAGDFPDRDVAVQAALTELSEQRRKHRRLLTELAKLDCEEERQLAEERLSAEVAWPAW